MKEKTKKPYKGMGSNALWSYREMLRGAPASFFMMAAGVPLGVFLSWVEIRLPALVVAVGGSLFGDRAAGFLQNRSGISPEPLPLRPDDCHRA